MRMAHEEPLADFASMFGSGPELVAEAPGRVNLIGEHTDYSGGFVLPTAIPQRTRVELRRREDDLVRAGSANVCVNDRLAAYRLGTERTAGTWLDYVKGVTSTLSREGYAL